MHITPIVRAVVIHQGHLLMCRHPGADFYCLPGGKLEIGETLSDGLARELIEETTCQPDIGRLLFINEFITPKVHRIEFFFLVNNGADYVNLDRTKASHSHELADLVLADPTDPVYNLKPAFLRDRFAEVMTRRHQFDTEIIRSS